jgi:putative intracellular protease/amidase
MIAKTLALLVCAVCTSTVVSAKDQTKKVLMIFSNGAPMGEHTAKNNLWEYAEPHHVFTMHGFTVDFVSPKGGRVPFALDADEHDHPGMVSYTIKYEGFREKADRTFEPDEVRPDDYVAVYVGGGAGSLFDIAVDPRLLSIIGNIYANGGVIGAGGHGSGSFGNVKLSTGQYLVAGKRMTGYPNSSEQKNKWSNGGALLPFHVEDRLREPGAIFLSKADLADKHDVVIDQRIVTTMFLPSSAIVAQEMVNLLKPQASTSGK